jgi:hypothetical protein
MSFVEPSSTKPGDDLDGLLRTFFRSEMSHPWPSPPLSRSPATLPMAPRRMVSGRSLIRGRWALAASVGLLLLVSLLLPGRLTSTNPSGSDAAWPHAIDFERQRMKMEQEMKKFQEKHKRVPGLEEDGQIGNLDDSDLS